MEITTNLLTRIRILRNDTRRLWREVDRYAAGDTVHWLHNNLATAQSALSLIERRITHGMMIDENDELLNLAKQRIQQTRASLARTRQVRWAAHHFQMHAGAYA
jgi:hypothetical protein